METSEEDIIAEPDASRVEYFFDKTEYHAIMAEALKTVPTAQPEGSVRELTVSGHQASADNSPKEGRRTFYLLALIYTVLVLSAGIAAFMLTEG